MKIPKPNKLQTLALRKGFFTESIHSPWGTVPNKRGDGKPILIRADGAGFLKWHNFD